MIIYSTEVHGETHTQRALSGPFTLKMSDSQPFVKAKRASTDQIVLALPRASGARGVTVVPAVAALECAISTGKRHPLPDLSDG